MNHFFDSAASLMRSHFIEEIQRELPVLSEDTAHVLTIHLNNFHPFINDLYQLLSTEERQRANEYFFLKDKNRYIIARGMLKIMLSAYLNIAPDYVQFVYSQYGKPYLPHFPFLQFNISHSEDMVIFAFNYKRLIGIDIEYTQKKIDIMSISQQFFSKREYHSLKSINSEDQKQAFFNAWVAKEAFIKALGLGLSFDLADIEVDCFSQDLFNIMAIHHSTEIVEDWCLYPINSCPDYVAAMAIKGALQKLFIKNIVPFT
ncbi:MAG: hypothetical protein LEGION0398_MBIBDBAK_01404 [Legionellaceae bacterium]